MKTKADPEQPAGSAGSMSLSGHLKELRNRILVCLLALAVCFALCLAFAPQLVTLLTDMGERYSYLFVYIAPQELLLVYLNVALLGAVVLCFPLLAYEAYAFCLPGLNRKEQVFTLGALIAGAVCFLLGVAFAYWISLPSCCAF